MTEPDFYHLATMLMLDALMDDDCGDHMAWDRISQYTLDEARDAG